MRRALFTTSLVLLPRIVLACPVCFGESDSPMALGINFGIWAMLLVTGGVLAGFATFFIHLIRRARMAASDSRGSVGFGATQEHGAQRGTV